MIRGLFMNRTFSEVWTKYQVWIIFIGLLITYSFISPDFFTPNNIRNILMQNSMLVIVSFGQLLAVISGGIDLSVASVLALSGVMVAKFINSGIATPIAIIMAGGVGAIVGSINGILISRFKFAPFIATLATLTMAKGMTLIQSGGHVIYVNEAIFTYIGTGDILGIPIIVWVMILITIIVAFILGNTIVGRRLLALGGNPEAARLAGINTKNYLFFTYVCSGFLCGLAGAFMATRLGAGSPTTGAEWELDSIAAVVVGGASLAGGIGTAFNSLLGALTIGFIRNILNLMGLAAYPQMIVKGLIIIIAVLGQGLGSGELLKIKIRREDRIKKIKDSESD